VVYNLLNPTIMKTKTGILQFLKSTLLLALFVSCTHENSELGVEKNNNNRNAQALVSKKIIIDNSENEYNLSFRLTAFIDTNQMGNIDPTLSFRNPEVNIRRGETKYFTDFTSISTQNAGSDLWYKYDSSGFTGSILSGEDANGAGGSFTKGFDDVNGYYAHWANIKGSVSGEYLPELYFERGIVFNFSPLSGGLFDDQNGLMEIIVENEVGNLQTLTILTYLTQDANSGDITVKFKSLPLQ
jgi:hypothetical protein